MRLVAKNVFLFAVLMAGLAPRTGFCLVGDPAPPLNVSEWIKGGPVVIKPGTNIYVVEIWETKSAPCRASITNFNDIQMRYKDKGVVVVAVSDEPAEKIKDFVNGAGTNIEYALAADNKRHTSLSYMKPIAQRGIPYAFIVGTNGDLLWHSQPQRGLTEALDRIIQGHFDEKEAKHVDLAGRHMEQYLAMARQGSDRVGGAGQALLKERTNDVPMLCDLAFEIATFPQLKARDFALAAAAMDQAESLAPTNAVPVGITRAILLFESGQRDAGLAHAKEVLASTENENEKKYIAASIHAMEKRLAAPAKSHSQDTNQPSATPDKDSAAKP